MPAVTKAQYFPTQTAYHINLMKSKFQFKGHPLHPILVSFPIAFFVGTLILDIAALVWQRADFQKMATYLEGGGIIFGLLAAVPGFVDFLYTIPPNSSGKNRAAKHGLINVTMLVTFSIAWLMRTNQDISLPWIITLETAGVVLLSIAGWLGGTLVYRNQIGIDIRYAHAGKWKEKYVDKSRGKIEVAMLDELKINQMKLIHVGGKRIVVCKTEKGHAAFDDHCTHRGGSLAGGAMICGTVQCPWHGSQFDVQTGMIKAGPATEGIKTYSVLESENKIFLMLG
jgi:uncharacterized membrane protein/nitrite reductase/ring-hydroxylating ferredoxin subunit